MNTTENVMKEIDRRTDRCLQWKYLNPNNWDSKKAAQAAITVFVVALVALIVSSLITRYPAWAGAFNTICGMTVAVSAIAAIIATIKCCRRNKEPLQQIASVVPDHNPFSDQKPIYSNPTSA